MKKNIILLLILFTGYQAFTQTLEHNLKKYWYFRDRLEQSFMIVGSPEKTGTNIPADYRHYYRANWLNWGENTILYNWMPYVCVLSTEYKLLKDYGKDEKAAETLQKIIWALSTFDRLDANAEKFFRARLHGIKEENPDYWTLIDNHKKFPQDLNGFFLRNDIDGTFDPSNLSNTEGAWYKNRKFPQSIENNILTYNNNQLVSDSLIYKNNLQNIISTVACPFWTKGQIRSRNRIINSGDEHLGVLLAVSFINKFVDDTTLFEDTEGNFVTAKQWAENIARRLTNYLSEHSFNITNPVNKNPVAAGSINLQYKVPIYHFMEENYDVVLSETNKFDELGWASSLTTCFNFWYKIPIGGMRNATPIYFYTAVLTNKVQFDFKNNKLAFFQYIMMNYSKENKSFSGEFYPLIYAVLNQQDPLNTWENKLKGYGFYTKYDFKKDVETLLNIVPDCGNFLKCNKNNPIYSNPNWFFRRLPGNNSFEKKKHSLKNCWKNGYSNDLEYMLLHNLYWIVFVDNEDVAEYKYCYYHPECQFFGDLKEDNIDKNILNNDGDFLIDNVAN